MSKSTSKNIVWFDEIGKEDIAFVGGKGANLGEMTQASFPIPFGFIITARSYFTFLKEAGLDRKIKELISSINFNNPHELQQVSQNVRELMRRASINKKLSHEIIKYYHELTAKEEEYLSKKRLFIKKGVHLLRNTYKSPFVAVRSSATAEDLPEASFAGQQETFLNVQGESNLLVNVRECWSSLFTERAIYYRHNHGFDDKKVGLAVIVQRMIQSDKSGVAFSIDPVTSDKNTIVIEAILGLGEYIVQGKVTPDHYVVNKRSLTITDKEVKKQSVKYIKRANKNIEVKLTKKETLSQKISDDEIIKLALLVKEIERHYYFPQDIEWAFEKNNVFIVQSRPVTTVQEQQIVESGTKLQTPFLVGAPASPGIRTGPATIISSPKEIGRVQKGDILVAPQTNPDYVPAMKKAVAIVTEKGGRTSHAAIVSRELGIPAVVGAEGVIHKVKNSMIITVNGTTGEIYKGSQKIEEKDKVEKSVRRLKTLTKVYVNLAEPDRAKEVSELDSDGVGLLRAEFMVADIGVHPKEFIKKKKGDQFSKKLSEDLLKFVKAFSPRPVMYRATDFKTNEYGNLIGGKQYEPHEENPMLGFRGAFRYTVDSDVFILELEALKSIWDKGYRNLHLMIPFIRRPWELVKIKEVITKVGLFSYKDFMLNIMVEVPSAALELEHFIKLGIDGVSIGTNDLTMMLLGVDRDNEHVAELYDERADAVTEVLEYIVKTCRKYQVTSSICGQAASDYPDLVESFIRLGITSISVNPDALQRSRELIYEIEKKHFKTLKNSAHNFTALSHL